MYYPKSDGQVERVNKDYYQQWVKPRQFGIFSCGKYCPVTV